MDPEVENGQESWSPYSFGFDNTIRYNDPNGRYPDGLGGPGVLPAPSVVAAFWEEVVNVAESLAGSPAAPAAGVVIGGGAILTGLLWVAAESAPYGGGRPVYMTGMPNGPGPGYSAATQTPSKPIGDRQVNGSSGTRPAKRIADRRENRGVLGKPETKAQVKEIADEMVDRGYKITGGGGRRKEEFLPGPDHKNSRKGSSRPDITAIKDGRTVRVNTVDTNADGKPDTRESNNATRIRQQTPGDHLLLIPKKK